MTKKDESALVPVNMLPETAVPGFLQPVVSLQQMQIARLMMVEIVKEAMKENIDFGVIPGTEKPTLLQPGAQKLMRMFGLHTRYVILEKVIDPTGEEHGGEPYYFYQYECQLWQGDQLVGSANGSCNSWEKRYRVRLSERACPECGKTVRKSKNSAEFYCWTKTGGCGATFHETDKRITEQTVGYVPNPDVHDAVNTIDKIAQKRALIKAVLDTTGASEFFTQDIEDIVIGTYTVVSDADRIFAAKNTFITWVETEFGLSAQSAAPIVKKFEQDMGVVDWLQGSNLDALQEFFKAELKAKPEPAAKKTRKTATEA